MAYPGEKQHDAYQRWSIEEQTNGRDGSRKAYKKHRETKKAKGFGLKRPK